MLCSSLSLVKPLCIAVYGLALGTATSASTRREKITIGLMQRNPPTASDVGGRRFVACGVGSASWDVFTPNVASFERALAEKIFRFGEWQVSGLGLLLSCGCVRDLGAGWT